MNHRTASRVVADVPMPDPGEYPHGGASDAWPYRGGVLRSVRPVALRWVFLVALALGIVGMHHMAMPGAEPRHAGHPVAATVSVASVEADPACCDDMPGHGGMHDLLHLCLAVLCAAAALLLSWLLLRRGATASPPRSRTYLAALAGRDPPRVHAPSTSLSSLCVLRL
jgi:Family of unknown function (DUF6153)